MMLIAETRNYQYNISPTEWIHSLEVQKQQLNCADSMLKEIIKNL